MLRTAIKLSKNLNFNIQSRRFQSTLGSYIENLNLENSNYKITDISGNEISKELKLSEIDNGKLKLVNLDNNNLETLIVLPDNQTQDLTQMKNSELEKMIKELQASLDDVNPKLKKLQSIEDRINQIDDELKPIEDKYDQILTKAQGQTDNRLVLYLGAWTVCTVSIGRLTWWEYSWDIMEPVAWAAQSGMMLFWGWYYFITKQGSDMSTIAGAFHDKGVKRTLSKEGEFSVEKYNKLVEERLFEVKKFEKLRRHI